MVKLIGPCMSMEARGTLNDVITYAVLGRTCYAKSHFTPRNPKSPGQISIRCSANFLTQMWKKFPKWLQDYFIPLAKFWNLSPYHAYLKYNMLRWNDFDMAVANPQWHGPEPTCYHIFQTTENNGTYSFEAAVYSTDGFTWAYQINGAQTSDFTPNRSNTKIILRNPTKVGSTYYFTGQWTRPDQLWYYFKGRYGIMDGQSSAFVSGA